MTRTVSPIHALPGDGADHRASSTCWCQPQATLRDAATGAPVWVHRGPHESVGADSRGDDIQVRGGPRP